MSTTGSSGDDILNGTTGNDTLNGGAGMIRSTVARAATACRVVRAMTCLNGGSGSDILNGDSGNDTLVYNLTENAGAKDVYTGGSGTDTLFLQLTSAQWQDPAVRAQLENYVQFLATVKIECAGRGIERQRQRLHVQFWRRPDADRADDGEAGHCGAGLEWRL